MNFQNIPKVDTDAQILDVAFRLARTMDKPKVRDRSKIVKTNEYDHIKAVAASIRKQMSRIIRSFPSIDNLEPFYKELLKTSLDYPTLKKSLGAVNWAGVMCGDFEKKYLWKIRKSNDNRMIVQIRQEFYGRISSILKQISKELKYLDLARQVLRKFPNIKTQMPTVTIAGYPNVGKSSLLKVLTETNPEIKDYAFTTKRINIGYYKYKNKKYQIVDVPGTFDRAFHKMNSIEKQAYFVIKYVADLVIFAVDPTETCGFSLELQLNLCNRIRKLHKNITVIYTKADLHKNTDYLSVSVRTLAGINELKKLIYDNKADSQ